MSFTRKLSLFLLLIAMIGLISCEKEVNISLSDGESQLVVNGQIELDQPPYVILTRSIGYFSKVDLQTLQASFIHDADVRVSNGVRSIKLREYSLDTGGSAKFYFYSLDTADLLNRSFIGEAEKFYTLTVNAGGKQYTSTTKIPTPRPVDSMKAVAPQRPPRRRRRPSSW